MPDGRWRVALWDHRRARGELLERAVCDAGGELRRIDSPEEVAEAVAERAPGDLALVSLGTLAAFSSALDAIGALNKGGFVVFAFEDGASSWSIGTRCHALIAGARRVLDSATPGFFRDLHGLLARTNDAELRRCNEEERLRRVMAEQGIVGRSPKMRALFSWIERVSAVSDAPVSIYGETGTGKELVARAIQRLDAKRNAGPFVAVNCGAISAGLAEGELFGHRRGAFTGAERDRKGLIRAADGGVLLLDEIGELDLRVQTRLLRVLQEQRVLAVGEDHEVPVDVRVIAVTHRDLGAMVRKRQFREDLYHRLNVLSSWIPPLRERHEDFEPLVELFLEMHGSKGRPRPTGVGPEFLAALAKLTLPGNVRQLENLVRGAIVQRTHDGPLELSDLPSEIWRELADEADALAPRATAEEDPGAPPRADHFFIDLIERHNCKLSDSLERCERLILENAMRLSGENQSRTARLLGITPRSVYNKLRKHHLKNW